MKRQLKWVQSDGGKAAAGFWRPTPGGCVVRAVALATGLDYRAIWDVVKKYNMTERQTARRRKRGRLSPGDGMHTRTFKRMMRDFGFKWTPTMFIGSGCKVHLLASELPKVRLIANLSKHVSYVDNRVTGIVYDLYDPRREGTRCCYGFWSLDDISDWKYE